MKELLCKKCGTPQMVTVNVHKILACDYCRRDYSILSIDFDGTLTKKACFPELGELDMDMVQAAIACREAGHILILWTCREGQYLEPAVKALKEQGLEFHAVNTCIEPIPAMPFTRKPYADFIYDDRNYNWDRDEALEHLRSLATIQNTAWT